MCFSQRLVLYANIYSSSFFFLFPTRKINYIVYTWLHTLIFSILVLIRSLSHSLFVVPRPVYTTDADDGYESTAPPVNQFLTRRKLRTVINSAASTITTKWLSTDRLSNSKRLLASGLLWNRGRLKIIILYPYSVPGLLLIL